MKRNLEKFISENRAAFDHAEPPLDLWERISENLEKKDTRSAQTPVRKMVLHVLKVAALTCLIGTTGIAIYFYGKKNAYDDYTRINTGLAALQQNYSRLVIQKKDSVAIFAAHDPALYGEFSKALDQMEANYELLRDEFANSPNKELTLEAMIRNLQAQIDVLSRQMEILKYLHSNKKLPKNEQI